MANFRTTADYVDKILDLSGEITNGNSAYEASALAYLNRVHRAVIGGGNEFGVDIDEIWPWAMAKQPLVLELQPKYVTGTISVTNNSAAITLSAAPAYSLAGYHINFQGDDNMYKITANVAGNTAATIDSLYPDVTAAALTFEAYKLDYELLPDVITIDDTNNKLDFTEATAGTVLTASMTNGTFPIATVVTALKTALDAAGASVYTVTYSTPTRKFTIVSDLAGADNIFSMLGASGTNTYVSILPTLGFGIQNNTAAATYTSERALGAIGKLSQAMNMHIAYKSASGIQGLDLDRFTTDYPLAEVPEGNPSRFTILEERDDGYVRVRFNKYPEEARRVEINYVPQPLALYDNAYSQPLVPLKYSQILTHGAATLLALEKNDSRAVDYLAITTNTLNAMLRAYRKTERRVNKNYGQIIAREDLLSGKRKRLLYGYEVD